jgi:hypothetical protein
LHIDVLELPRCELNRAIALVHPPAANDLVKGSNLLRANKVICQEALTTRYGKNTFLFKELHALRVFACYVGDNKAMLRYIRLLIDRTRTTCAAWNALYPTPHLQSLDLRILPESGLVSRRLYQQTSEVVAAFTLRTPTSNGYKERHERLAVMQFFAVSGRLRE